MTKELELVNLTRGRAGFQAELLQAVEDVFQTPHSLKEENHKMITNDKESAKKIKLSEQFIRARCSRATRQTENEHADGRACPAIERAGEQVCE